ncbi:hypothetical protein FD744_25235 [Pantoea sp. Taur]|nr:hypothetical protein [Pantoea sp. Taur]
MVIRNLHHSTPAEIINEELSNMGFKVRQIINVHKENREQTGPSSKTPLPLFFVDLEPTPGVEKIYEINCIYYTKIKIEKPYPKRGIVQCHNCQSYGHTRRYCHHLPRCVKCGESHKTENCTKPREIPAVCALCHQGHPANYKGCETYKNIKHRSQPAHQQTEAAGRGRQPSKMATSSVSYAQMLGDRNQQIETGAMPQPLQQSHPQPQTQHVQPRPQLPPKQQSQTSSIPSNPHSTSLIPPPSNATDLTTLLTSFLSEFRTLITPLISLLTNVISHFIPPQRNP